MNVTKTRRMLGMLMVMSLAPAACEKEPAPNGPASPAPPEKKEQPATATPGEAEGQPAHGEMPARPSADTNESDHAGHEHKGPSHAHAAASTPTAEGDALPLAGLGMNLPAGWLPQPAAGGASVAKAVFALPPAEGDTSGALLRITHFPAMKGMDDSNINRWLSLVRHPSGRASTRDDAKITVTKLPGAQLTVLDITGTVGAHAKSPGAGVPDQRMIAVILDHPKGPHFVKVIGGVATMQRWEAAIDAFMKSAKVQP